MNNKVLVGCRCSFRNCPNTTRATDFTSFFHFPVKNQQRCMKWIENSRKPHYYDLEEEELKNKVVCHEHFEERWFTTKGNTRRLIPGAVPTLEGMKKEGVPAEPFDNDIKNKPEFTSNQYKDVEVVPMNEDKTSFVLAAENMFTESRKIESYVIKNGSLVPSTTASKPVNRQKTYRANPNIFHRRTYQYQDLNELTAQKTQDQRINPLKNNVSMATTQPTSQPVIQKDEPPAKMVKKEVLKEQIITKDIIIKKEFPDPVDPLETLQKPQNHSKLPDKISSEYQDIDSIEVHYENNSNLDSKSALEKTYLKKIKQHSKEIANIKKLLTQKSLNEKPDLSTAFSVIQEKLPPTMVSIVRLVLGLKNDLTEEDVEFFTTLHRTSPEAYLLLSDKYSWNLPSVDVVEADE